MRSRPSQPLKLALVGIAIVGLAACVEPANIGKSSDTLAPLVLSPTTSTTALTAPLGSAAVPPSQTVVLGAGAVTTGGAATTVPPGGAAATGATTTVSAAAAAAASAADTTTTSVTGAKSYTILASDTMYSIARRCAQTADALATFNGWSDGANHLIHPGDVIELPCTPSPSSSGSATTATTTTTTTVKGSSGATSTTVAVVAGGTYTIVAGDYLAGIAAKVGTTIDAIVQVNGWADRSHAIYPGDVIKLPAKT